MLKKDNLRLRIAFAAVLWTLALLIQIPLWIGHGGWLQVATLERELQEQQNQLERDKAATAALAAEVQSLNEGTKAIEECARRELYMVRPGEILFRLQKAPAQGKRKAASPGVQTPSAPSSGTEDADTAVAPEAGEAAPVAENPDVRKL